jgi:aminoglycoside phosphotransferase (APT) family kinase protein
VAKANIVPELAARLVAEQFPHWAGLPVSRVALDGWDNTTFRLGDELSVRLPSADRYIPQVEKEHRWLPRLASELPLPIPEPVAKGAPTDLFPRPWSVYRWLDGDPATPENVVDSGRFALDLADFLAALYRIDAAGGPPAGEHSFFRGGPLAVYDEETRDAISALRGDIDAVAASETWEAALAATWTHAPVWLHGDVTASNLLVVGSRLSAVIDFGCCAVGDPACDLAIAWTFFSGDSRETFRERVAFDDATWARARGWALWKALITIPKADAERAASRFGWRFSARRVVGEVLAETT